MTHPATPAAHTSHPPTHHPTPPKQCAIDHTTPPPWHAQVARDEYRAQRLAAYRNYVNCIPADACAAVRAELVAGWPQPALHARDHWPYAFVRNHRHVASSVVHFQLRNLLCAPSAHDAVLVHDSRLQHWSAVTRATRDVLDLRGQPKGPRLPGIGRVQVCLANVVWRAERRLQAACTHTHTACGRRRHHTRTCIGHAAASPRLPPRPPPPPHTHTRARAHKR
jgi:hypothetical protein